MSVSSNLSLYIDVTVMTLFGDNNNPILVYLSNITGNKYVYSAECVSKLSYFCQGMVGPYVVNAFMTLGKHLASYTYRIYIMSLL